MKWLTVHDRDPLFVRTFLHRKIRTEPLLFHKLPNGQDKKDNVIITLKLCATPIYKLFRHVVTEMLMKYMKVTPRCRLMTLLLPYYYVMCTEYEHIEHVLGLHVLLCLGTSWMQPFCNALQNGCLHDVRDASLVCGFRQFLTAWRLLLSMKPWSYIWLEFGLFSTIIVAIIRACACWALFVVTLTNTVHLIYIYVYIYICM